MGLTLNLTQVSSQSSGNRFDITISCSLDYSTLGMTKPSDNVLQKYYEIPKDATTVIQVNLH